MNISELPHNLILDLNSNFIYLYRPIANIISTEWYIKYSEKNTLTSNYSKSIWIPTEGGDFTIAKLYSNLESNLLKFNFTVEQALIPDQPISSELNIVVSHGTDHIAFDNVIYPDSNPRLDISAALGEGKILILFVCHSGSVKSTPFENSTSSIIKKFLAMGYTSIIAPAWALNIDIPPIWLPKLIERINNGDKLITALHEANMTVYNHFPTISAWACMHLFGDPHISNPWAKPAFP